MISLTPEQQEALHCLTFNLFSIAQAYPDIVEAIAAVLTLLYADVLDATHDEAAQFADAVKAELVSIQETYHADISSCH